MFAVSYAIINSLFFLTSEFEEARFWTNEEYKILIFDSIKFDSFSKDWLSLSSDSY